MIRNLGAVITILADQEASEQAMHADVDAWYAPSECHQDVARGEERRILEAIHKAEDLAGQPLKVIAAELKERTGIVLHSGDPKWDELVGRVYHSYGLPF